MNIYSTINSIGKGKHHPGGLCNIQFIAWEEIIEWPKLNPNTNTIDGHFLINPESSIFQIKAADKDRIFKEESKTSPQGLYYDQSLTCRLNGVSRSNSFILQAMAGKRFAVFFKDRYGDLKFIGNNNIGADFQYSYMSGDISTSRSFLLQFKIESTSTAAVIDHFPTGVFASEFSFDFE